MREVTFYEQYEWSSARNAMKFWAVVDGDPLICWIDEAGLRAFARGEHENENVQAYFMENQARIRKVAKSMILSQCFDADGTVCITSSSLSIEGK